MEIVNVILEKKTLIVGMGTSTLGKAEFNTIAEKAVEDGYEVYYIHTESSIPFYFLDLLPNKCGVIYMCHTKVDFEERLSEIITGCKDEDEKLRKYFSDFVDNNEIRIQK